MAKLQQQREQERKRITQKAKDAEKRCARGLKEKKLAIAQKRAASCNNMDKVKEMALEEEETRKQRILQNQNKAESSRKRFFQKRAKEQKLNSLRRKLKKERVFENVRRCHRQKQFKKFEILKKQEKDDMRRKENIRLQMMLKQQRLLNNYESKQRLNTYRKNFEDAVQSGESKNLDPLMKQIEEQMNGKIGMSVPKGATISETHVSKTSAHSSSAQVTRLKASKIKSQLK